MTGTSLWTNYYRAFRYEDMAAWNVVSFYTAVYSHLPDFACNASPRWVLSLPITTADPYVLHQKNTPDSTYITNQRHDSPAFDTVKRIKKSNLISQVALFA